MQTKTKSRIPNPEQRALLLAALHEAQDQFGWLNSEATQQVADRLGLPLSQVYSTASFYSMFKLRPQGRYRIQVCEGLSCYLVGGAEPIIDYIRRKMNLNGENTSPDGRFTLDVVQCLAACDLAPAIKINDDLYGNITAEELDNLLCMLSTGI